MVINTSRISENLPTIIPNQEDINRDLHDLNLKSVREVADSSLSPVQVEAELLMEFSRVPLEEVAAEAPSSAIVSLSLYTEIPLMEMSVVDLYETAVEIPLISTEDTIMESSRMNLDEFAVEVPSLPKEVSLMELNEVYLDEVEILASCTEVPMMEMRDDYLDEIV